MIRSILSVPAHHADMAEKARTRGADMIAWDLEDSVPLDRKEQALAGALLHAMPGDAIRVNNGREIRTIAKAAPGAMINLPKVEYAEQVERVKEDGLIVLAIIESPRGVLNAGAICAVAHAVAFGRADFRAAAGLADPDARLIEHAMAAIAMAAQAHGIPAYDSPCEDLRSERAMTLEVRRARELGFTGKICIHPSQIPGCALFAQNDYPELVGQRGTGAREVDGRVYAEPHYRLADKLAGRT